MPAPFTAWASREKRAIAPDAFIEITEADGGSLLAFVELDMGSMSHRRLKTKAAGYAGYVKVEAWRERHRFCPALLFLTTVSLERYFRAFEEGTMPESACAPRIGELSEKLRGLEARREELAVEEPSEREPLTDEDLALLQAEVRKVIEGGDPPTRKALLQSLVDETRVVSRPEIFPSFSLHAVRPPQRAVPLRGFEPRFLA
jgi:hypothetical protein